MNPHVLITFFCLLVFGFLTRRRLPTRSKRKGRPRQKSSWRGMPFQSRTPRRGDES